MKRWTPRGHDQCLPPPGVSTRSSEGSKCVTFSSCGASLPFGTGVPTKLDAKAFGWMAATVFICGHLRRIDRGVSLILAFWPSDWLGLGRQDSSGISSEPFYEKLAFHIRHRSGISCFTSTDRRVLRRKLIKFRSIWAH